MARRRISRSLWPSSAGSPRRRCYRSFWCRSFSCCSPSFPTKIMLQLELSMLCLLVVLLAAAEPQERPLDAALQLVRSARFERAIPQLAALLPKTQGEDRRKVRIALAV